ncbi:Alpha-L-fucosidase [Ostertagia ostertagi]
MSTALMLAVALHLLLGCFLISAKYQPKWPSIDSRPLPQWYDDVKFGIFCHWGVYSVPAFRSEWFWWYWKGDKPDKDVVNYVNRNYKPGTTYADFAKDFTAELFDAKEFADIVKSSGAKYFVLTSKHHEGFTMWPSKSSWNWNAVDVGPKRDIVGEIKDAFKGTDVHFGLYYSLFEWFHPMFIDDCKYNTTAYVDDVIVVNDRWGGDSMGKHGGFFTYSDHYDPGKLMDRKWENCMTLDKGSWGHRRTMKSADVNTVHELIVQWHVQSLVAMNFLLNVVQYAMAKYAILRIVSESSEGKRTFF